MFIDLYLAAAAPSIERGTTVSVVDRVHHFCTVHQKMDNYIIPNAFDGRVLRRGGSVLTCTQRFIVADYQEGARKDGTKICVD